MSRTLERIVAIILITGAAVYYIQVDRWTLDHKLSESQRMLAHYKYVLDRQFDNNDRMKYKLVEEILSHKTTQMKARLGESND